MNGKSINRRLSNGHGGYKQSYVVFTTPSGMKKALKAKFQEAVFLSTPEKPIVLGMEKWIQEYNSRILDVPTVKGMINKYMEAHDKTSKEEEEEAKQEEGVPDDKGWVKVTKLSKKAVFSRTEANEKRIKEKELKKNPRKMLQNFYTFQIRESKMNHIALLRQKFEDDKRRIALMKERRKFKPY